MTAAHELIERGIPDRIESDSLPPVVAAQVDFLAGRNAPWTQRGAPMVRARAWVASGCEAEATALLASTDMAECDSHELVAASWAVARVGGRSMADTLLQALANQPAFLVADGVPLGPRSLAEGPLIAATGDLAAAVARLDEAVVAGDDRAPVWGALARSELARVKLCAEAVGDHDAATTGQTSAQLISAATLFFRAGGYHALLARTDQLTHPDDGTLPLGAPTVGRFRPGPSWRLGFGVMGDVSMRPAKGLVLIHHLVQNPGRAVPAVVLDAMVNGGSGVDEVLEFAARLRSGEIEIEDDEAAREVRTLLRDEVVRSRIGKLLSRTIGRIENEHPLVARHLRSTLRTGHSCRYDPPGGVRVVWHT